MHRGTEHAASHALHTILTANDDPARTMYTVAARTDRELLPAPVAVLLDHTTNDAPSVHGPGANTALKPGTRSRFRTIQCQQTPSCWQRR
jgi:hypothetical protein